MVRTYKKVLGAKHYGNYSDSALKKAIEAVRSKRMTYRSASEAFQVPIATLCNKIKNKHPMRPGGLTALSQEEELSLRSGIEKAAEWGFPLTRMDIRTLVKQFLDAQGKRVKCFKENMPGLDWFYKFLKRNPVLTERMCQNIKRCRAELSPEIIHAYFDNLSQIIQDVPACNIINYDETNLCDDPGRTKVVCKRGTKYVNRILDSSKSSTSIMVSATGSGKLLPAYVVYRAQHLYPTWTENGPDNAVYNRTKSGWFEGAVYEDWFEKVALPYFRKCTGRRILIGDNLSSHLSIRVIQLCEQNNIEFILLPPNATHLLQPLDVAFFAPFKKIWRKLLTEWKQKNRGVLPKSDFPRLLKKLFDNVELNAAKNIISGFRASGIFPCDRNVVLNKLPKLTEEQLEQQQNQAEIDRRWSSTFVNFMKESRTLETKQNIKRGKKINVAPGKGIRARDLGETSASREQSSTGNEFLIESDQSDKEESGDDHSDMEENGDDHSDMDEFIPGTNNPQDSSFEDITDQNLSANDYILVSFKCPKKTTRFFIGKIIEVFVQEPETVFVNFLRQKKSSKLESYFFYPDVKDEAVINRSDIVMKLSAPKDLRRNRFMFKNLPKGYVIE